MKIIKRNMSGIRTELSEEHLPYCQASFNSDGVITLRNYDRRNKDRDEIIILSNTETEAIFLLLSRIGQKNKNYDLPF